MRKLHLSFVVSSFALLLALAGDFELHHDAWGRLVLVDDEGHKYVGVEPVRAFPISDPDHFISLCDAESREFARGLSNYSSSQVTTIAGQAADRIAELLGHCPYVEVVHRDNLVVLI